MFLAGATPSADVPERRQDEEDAGGRERRPARQHQAGERPGASPGCVGVQGRDGRQQDGERDHPEQAEVAGGHPQEEARCRDQQARLRTGSGYHARTARTRSGKPSRCTNPAWP